MLALLLITLAAGRTYEECVEACLNFTTPFFGSACEDECEHVKNQPTGSNPASNFAESDWREDPFDTDFDARSVERFGGFASDRFGRHHESNKLDDVLGRLE